MYITRTADFYDQELTWYTQTVSNFAALEQKQLS
jgi:hypothetical protein